MIIPKEAKDITTRVGNVTISKDKHIEVITPKKRVLPYYKIKFGNAQPIHLYGIDALRELHSALRQHIKRIGEDTKHENQT